MIEDSITKTDLEIAKAILSSPRRWTKGNYYKGGRVCLQKAIAMAHDPFREPLHVGVSGALAAKINRALRPFIQGSNVPFLFPSVISFNDEDATTLKDVHELLDRAIEGMPEC